MQEVKVIGNLYPEKPHQSGNVYSVDGIAQTLMSGTHGYGIGFFVEVKRMNKPKRIGNIYGEDRGTGFAGNVWDKECISPTITTMQGGGENQ